MALLRVKGACWGQGESLRVMLFYVGITCGNVKGERKKIKQKKEKNGVSL